MVCSREVSCLSPVRVIFSWGATRLWSRIKSPRQSVKSCTRGSSCNHLLEVLRPRCRCIMGRQDVKVLGLVNHLPQSPGPMNNEARGDRADGKAVEKSSVLILDCVARGYMASPSPWTREAAGCFDCTLSPRGSLRLTRTAGTASQKLPTAAAKAEACSRS